MYTGLTDSLWRGAERKELSLTLNGTAVTGALLTLTITAGVNGEQPLLTVGNTWRQDGADAVFRGADRVLEVRWCSRLSQGRRCCRWGVLR